MDATKLRIAGGIEEPKKHPPYTLAQLLDDSDYFQPMPTENREWIDAPRVGRELV
jgi:antitoxin ChpS